MSDAGITIIVAGVVQIAVIFVGYLKLKYGVDKANDAATTAATKAHIVEKKLDANTVTTESVEEKTDTIIGQTNGVLTHMQDVVTQIAERVNKLEDYNRSSSHRLLDAMHTLHTKLAEISVLSKMAVNMTPAVQPTEPPKP